VRRDREENLTKITDQRRKIQNEIQEERRKINEHLDKLEEQLIGNLDAEEAKIKSEIENLLENLHFSSSNVVTCISSSSTSRKIVLPPRNVCRSDAQSFTANNLLCNISIVTAFLFRFCATDLNQR
jgi:transcriptional regulator of heat shock response